MPVRGSIKHFLVGATVMLGGCDSGSEVLGKNWPAYRYKLAAAVDTPEGVRTGHSVVEVAWHRGSSMFGSQQMAGFQFQGQAVAVDLPRGQTLFILLRTKESGYWPAYALNGVFKREAELFGDDRSVYPLPRTIRIGVDDVPNYPLFIRFRSIRDPASVEQVDPDDLAKSYGPGIKLRALTVQLTTLPITRGLIDRLPWWKDYVNRNLDGTSARVTDLRVSKISDRLSSGDFTTEL